MYGKTVHIHIFNNEGGNGMNEHIEEIAKYFISLKQKRMGAVLLPSINGFDVYEFDEDYLRVVIHLLGESSKIEALTSDKASQQRGRQRNCNDTDIRSSITKIIDMERIKLTNKRSENAEKELRISDVSDNEVKFCEDCQKWVKPPKCNHCGNTELIPDWTY